METQKNLILKATIKNSIKVKFILFLVFTVIIGCSERISAQKNNKKEALLVGTFHYNNPGLDVAKTKSFDILSEKSQLELEQISSKIKTYNPTKIFVEWPYNEQKKLDSLYQLYKEGKYFTNDNLSDFYMKNEIIQLAFRVAKKNNLPKVYGIDYEGTEFPYDKVMNDIEANNQTNLKEKLNKGIEKFSTEFNEMITSGKSLKEITLALNTEEHRYTSNNIHNSMSLAGSINDLNGVYLTSEWHKRNLYMWSFIQKLTSNEDERIMILAGASHISMIAPFIKENKEWGTIELVEVLNK